VTAICGKFGVLLNAGARGSTLSAEEVRGRVSTVEVKETKLQKGC
jgi:hypothetical protein